MTTPELSILSKKTLPRPSSGHLSALAEADRPLAIFSDFDGTIFLQDTGHVLFDEFGCGPEKREELDKSIGKTKTFRQASEELWGSLDVPLDKAIETLQEKLVIDPDFYTFFQYCEDHDIPFTVISAGMKPLLRAALDAFLGPERSAKIHIISNDGEISPDGKVWKPLWIHDSPLGHDKARSVQDWKAGVKEEPMPKIVFIGDGVSDLAAASQADILFARKGLALEDFCIEHMIPYIPYDRFKDIIHDVQRLVRGNRYHDKEAASAYRRNKLAQLTGLAPLTMAGDEAKPVKSKAAFGLANSDSDSEDDEPTPARPRRPSSPTYPPNFESVNRPGFNRQSSVGEIPDELKQTNK